MTPEKKIQELEQHMAKVLMQQTEMFKIITSIINSQRQVCNSVLTLSNKLKVQPKLEDPSYIG